MVVVAVRRLNFFSNHTDTLMGILLSGIGMMYDIGAVVFLLLLSPILLWVSARLAFPVTGKHAFGKTTASESFFQFAYFPALMFVVALALGVMHQIFVGPGCRDMSQPMSVAPNSRAASLGLMSGDSIVRINGAATDCFGEMRLIGNATTASLLVKRSAEKGGGEVAIPLTRSDSLQHLFRNGLHLPILRHPVSWRDADWTSHDYFRSVGQGLAFIIGGSDPARRPVSSLYPEEGSVDLMLVGTFLMAYLSYFVPVYFSIRATIEWLKSNKSSTINTSTQLAYVRVIDDPTTPKKIKSPT